jgi:hypothetical protein
MKFGFAILLVFAALMVAAETALLEWTPSASRGVAGYRVYYGTNSGVYPFAADVGLVTTNVVELPWRGPWFFAVTARDTNGFESPFSNEAAVLALPEAPLLNGETWVGLRPVIECSTNLAAWSSVTGAPTWLPATNAMEFFRPREFLIERAQRVETKP